MTEQDQQHCVWCGRPFPAKRGPGRPRRYCRRSHRQRAFEARRLAERMGLDTGEALVSAVALTRLRDRMYLLEEALRDVEADLRGTDDDAEYRAAFRHLYAAAAQLRGVAPEPIAMLANQESANTSQ